MWLTKPVDLCLHLFHPLEDSLTPDGVVVMGSLESLRTDVDLPLDGAQVQQRCGHAERQQQPFNPAGSHPHVHFEVRRAGKMRRRRYGRVDLQFGVSLLSLSVSTPLKLTRRLGRGHTQSTDNSTTFASCLVLRVWRPSCFFYRCLFVASHLSSKL